jgi:isoleucyl-tRNA synthetase
VHLTDWPEAKGLPEDAELVGAMDRVRAVCSTILALRDEKRLPVRQPLEELAISGFDFTDYEELLMDETNVKRVVASAMEVRKEVVLNFKAVGPRLGVQVKALAAALKRGAYFHPDGDEALIRSNDVADVELDSRAQEFSVRFVPEGVDPRYAVAVLPGTRVIVGLNTVVSPRLRQEGIARNLVRLIQQARKDAKLHISDRICLRVAGDAALAEAVRAHGPYIREQTLAVELELGAPPAGWFTAEGEVGEGKATVALVKAGVGS